MLLLRWLLNALILILVARLTPGIEFTSFWAALVTSLVLGFLNALIRPLILILTLPINLLTLGLFTLVINALMFWLAGSIVKGFDIASFGSAFIGALIYSAIVMIVGYFEKSPAKKSIR
jgi:putative membrane protein